ncbi:MAG: hypothetical protein ACC658_02220 [Acidimicrobiia bacterium]
MKTMKYRWVIVSGFLVVTLAACSPASLTEQILENQEGVGNVEINEEDGTFKIEIEDEEGDVSAVFGGGEVPDGFPIPIADGGTVAAVLEQQSDSTVSLTYDGADYDKLKAFYEEWVNSSSAEELNKFETSAPKSITWTLGDGNDSYTVQVIETGDQTTVNLFVTKS